jgi:hypothetical protein
MGPGDIAHELPRDHELWHAHLPPGAAERGQNRGDVGAGASQLAVDVDVFKRADPTLEGDSRNVQPIVTEHVRKRTSPLEYRPRHQPVEDTVVFDRGKVSEHAGKGIGLTVLVGDTVFNAHSCSQIACSARDKRQFGVVAESGEAGCHVTVIEPIVVGEHHHVVSTAGCEQEVEVGGGANVSLLSEVAHSWVARSRLAADRFRAVARGVIGDNHLEPRVRLRERRGESTSQRRHTLVSRHRDADQWLVGHYDRRGMVGTCVVYLVWAGLGVEPLERFATSYREHPAGLEHQLVLVLKGVVDDPVASRCREIVDELDAKCLELPAVGLDLDTYQLAARRLRASELCLLNSSSEIRARGWLAGLHRALERPDVGLAGATGSYESALSAGPRPLRPLLRHRYPPFPNPHVRTNGFMLERDLMLTLDWPASGRKRRALELESGARSITRQVRARGLQTLVVGRDGRGYEPERWYESRTFRSGSQENLLIADNRTRQYADAHPDRRAELARFAWGDAGSLTPPALTAVPPAPAPRV